MDDYWVAYESPAADPYLAAGRTEHQPNCTGDFIGLNQRKWQNLAGECDGNIDGYSFVFWATNGDRRVNYSHTNAGVYVPDIQSGLRNWTRWRGSEANAFTQLADFNSSVPVGKGFRFADVKNEIDQGYPVLVYLQNPTTLSVPRGSIAKGNPPIHGMMIYGYGDYQSFGFQEVYYRTSWGFGEGRHAWASDEWEAGIPTRGVIGYRPVPKITDVTRSGDELTFTWEGPSSRVQDGTSGAITMPHRYQLLRGTSLSSTVWKPAGNVTTDNAITITEAGGGSAFYRLRLLHPGETP